MIPRRRRMPDETKPEETNMTPMIDIVFQLLIFFMLSMHFKEVEGKLMSQLPRFKGPPSAPVNDPELHEIRIVLCAADEPAHHQDKGRHDRSPKNPDVCRILVDGHTLGEVHRTEAKPEAAAPNRALYKAISSKVRELYPLVPKDKLGRATPVIIDGDSEVPYEHIIGAVNACKEAGVDKVEFAANPRHEKYFK